MIFWPKVLMLNLCPYNVIQATILNNYLLKKAQNLQIQFFSYSEVEPNIQHIHSIFFSVYNLSPELASVKSLPIWNAHSCLVVKFGRSPRHVISV